MWTALTVAIVPWISQGDVVTEALEETTAGGGRVVREVYRHEDGRFVEHGLYERFHATGEKAERGEYEHGLRQGRWRGWSEEGELVWKGAYRGGMRSGTWTFSHPDGTPRAEGRYEDGRPSGPWQTWTPDGALDPVESGTYSAGRIEEPGGMAVYEGDLLDGRPHGDWTGRWSNGAPMLAGKLRRGRRHGVFRFFHADGTPDPEMVSGVYVDGRRAAALPRRSAEAQGDAGAEAGRPAEAPPPGDLDSLTGRDRVRIEALLASFLEDEGAARRRSAEELRRWERGVFPVALATLRGLDLTEAADRVAGGTIVSEVLAPLCGGRSFGWSGGDAPEELSADRLAVLRWGSFWELARTRSELWDLDLSFPVDPRRDGVPEELLRPVLALDEVGLDVGEPPAAEALGGGLGEAAGGAAGKALAWLARHQGAGGLWSSDGFSALCPAPADGEEETPAPCGMPGYPSVEAGVTGLALIAFLESGSTTRSGEHQGVVLRAVRGLIASQHRDGSIWTGKTPDGRGMYEHAVATYALARAAQGSRSQRLRRAVQDAAAFTLRIRNPYGGWRYSVPPKGDNDTSMTSWMARGLLAAREADVPLDSTEVGRAMEGTLNWVDEVTDPATGRVGYDEFGSFSARDNSNLHYPPEKGEAMTAAGLLLRFELGQTPDDHPILQKHADLMLKTLPEWDPQGFGCDMTYWSYGTRAMARVGGKHGKRWFEALAPALLDGQRQDGDAEGSWDPIGPWGYYGGRVYSTATLATTALALAR